MASLTVYKKLLDPDWKPQQRQRLAITMEEGGDDWGMVEDQGVVKQPKRKRRRRALKDGLPWSSSSDAPDPMPLEDEVPAG
eukprot:9001593-Pyramimonas_sp.AAC.1